MVSGLKGLRYYLKRFPEVMKSVRYLDVTPDVHAQACTPGGVQHHKFVLCGCQIQLCELPHLRLITIRDMPYNHRYGTHRSLWLDYKCTLEVLSRSLDQGQENITKRDSESKIRALVIAMQFQGAIYDTMGMAEDERAFLEKWNLMPKHGQSDYVLEADVKQRWEDLGI